MRTSARPRTLVLDVSDVVIDVAMLGPQGQELGPRQLVPITTETATLWLAIEQLGEFDRITLIGSDPHGLGERIARRSQRPLRRMSAGDLYWRHVISGSGVELALLIGPRFCASLFHGGVEISGPDLGMQLIRKDRRLREYLAPRVLERRGEEVWLKRVTRAIDEILSVWNPTTLYIAAPAELPMPPLPAQVVLVPSPVSREDALRVWNAMLEQQATT